MPGKGGVGEGWCQGRVVSKCGVGEEWLQRRGKNCYWRNNNYQLAIDKLTEAINKMIIQLQEQWSPTFGNSNRIVSPSTTYPYPNVVSPNLPISVDSSVENLNNIQPLMEASLKINNCKNLMDIIELGDIPAQTTNVKTDQ
ncbi:14939_t:CDS:2, partial [Dentiscutata heterogama]